MLLRLLSDIEGSVDKVVDSLLPVISSIAWIVAIRLINRWLPRDSDKEKEEDAEERPDLPMD